MTLRVLNVRFFQHSNYSVLTELKNMSNIESKYLTSSEIAIISSRFSEKRASCCSVSKKLVYSDSLISIVHRVTKLLALVCIHDRQLSIAFVCFPGHTKLQTIVWMHWCMHETAATLAISTFSFLSQFGSSNLLMHGFVLRLIFPCF